MGSDANDNSFKLFCEHIFFASKIYNKTCNTIIAIGQCDFFRDTGLDPIYKSNRKAMNMNWRNQKANLTLKTKTGNKKILQID